jgi:DNA-binding beta-propeller fold protein YncE
MKKLITICVAAVLVLLTSVIAHADYIYVSCYGTIEKFDSSGNRSTFASGLYSMGLAFDSSGNLYAAEYDYGTIEKFDSSGNRSIFASGLNSPMFVAVQPIPEPATAIIMALGAVMLKRRR